MSLTRAAVLGGAALVVVLLGVVAYIRWSPEVQVALPTQPLSPALDPVALAATYRTEVALISSELTPYLERELGDGDVGALEQLRDRLVQLTVPRDAQPHHLALTLALSRLAELLRPGRVVVASRSAPTVRGTQAELKQLIAQPTAL